MTQPKILLLDEPMSGLAPVIVESVRKLAAHQPRNQPPSSWSSRTSRQRCRGGARRILKAASW
jgi:energy-coupling factor transporter ATP-binding protein EcfA2